MSLETEKNESWPKRQGIEFGGEIEKNKEDKESEELKAAAAMERAEVIVKEVKQSKKQMQNIVLNMQQVMQAIQLLRSQLQLASSSDDPSSVKQDKEQIEKLKKKIGQYVGEIEKMQDDLVQEQVEILRGGEGAGSTDEELKQKAEEMVTELLRVIRE